MSPARASSRNSQLNCTPETLAVYLPRLWAAGTKLTSPRRARRGNERIQAKASARSTRCGRSSSWQSPRRAWASADYSWVADGMDLTCACRNAKAGAPIDAPERCGLGGGARRRPAATTICVIRRRARARPVDGRDAIT